MNHHTIVTYCSGNFTDCLKSNLDSWLATGDDICVYTDDVEKLESLSDAPNYRVLLLTKEKSSKKRVSCMRKIDTIQRAIGERLHTSVGAEYMYNWGVTWLDSDCFIRKNPVDVYRIQADLLCTRMVERDIPFKSINAGVSFWRPSERTYEFCKRWRKRAIELEDRNLNEQEAFNELCYKCFDWRGPCSVAPVSEFMFNCERDNDDAFKKLIKQVRPYVIHLKGGRWKRRKDFGL